MSKPAHHSGSYQVRARKVVAEAEHRDRLAAEGLCSPTHCWRCGRTLASHPPHRNGVTARWTAGHVVDGHPDSVLLAEASTCNFRSGAIRGNRLRTRLRTTRDW